VHYVALRKIAIDQKKRIGTTFLRKKQAYETFQKRVLYNINKRRNLKRLKFGLKIKKKKEKKGQDK